MFSSTFPGRDFGESFWSILKSGLIHLPHPAWKYQFQRRERAEGAVQRRAPGGTLGQACSTQARIREHGASNHDSRRYLRGLAKFLSEFA